MPVTIIVARRSVPRETTQVGIEAQKMHVHQTKAGHNSPNQRAASVTNRKNTPTNAIGPIEVNMILRRDVPHLVFSQPNQ